MRGRVHLRARAPALRKWKMKSIFDSNFHKSIQKKFFIFVPQIKNLFFHMNIGILAIYRLHFVWRVR